MERVFFFFRFVLSSLSFLLRCVCFLLPLPKAIRPEGPVPWPRCVTSWEPQKAKAGEKGRQRTYLALFSHWLCATQAAKAPDRTSPAGPLQLSTLLPSVL